MDAILNDQYDGIPKIYTPSDLAGNDDLFRARTGLFFTPTANIPAEWVGEGRMDVVLPLASPTAYEWVSNPAFRVPRLWVDLLQKATGKIRWTPISPAKITIVRYGAPPQRTGNPTRGQSDMAPIEEQLLHCIKCGRQGLATAGCTRRRATRLNVTIGPDPRKASITKTLPAVSS